jgi:hypothetical protein
MGVLVEVVQEQVTVVAVAVVIAAEEVAAFSPQAVALGAEAAAPLMQAQTRSLWPVSRPATARSSLPKSQYPN